MKVEKEVMNPVYDILKNSTCGPVAVAGLCSNRMLAFR